MRACVNTRVRLERVNVRVYDRVKTKRLYLNSVTRVPASIQDNCSQSVSHIDTTAYCRLRDLLPGLLKSSDKRSQISDVGIVFAYSAV